MSLCPPDWVRPWSSGACPYVPLTGCVLRAPQGRGDPLLIRSQQSPRAPCNLAHSCSTLKGLDYCSLELWGEVGVLPILCCLPYFWRGGGGVVINLHSITKASKPFSLCMIDALNKCMVIHENARNTLSSAWHPCRKRSTKKQAPYVPQECPTYYVPKLKHSIPELYRALTSGRNGVFEISSSGVFKFEFPIVQVWM